MNIKDENKKALDKLLNQYRLDLYNNNYKSSSGKLIQASMFALSTSTSSINSSMFLLKESLYSYRFIGFPKNNIDRNEITKRFIRYSDLDKIVFVAISSQYIFIENIEKKNNEEFQVSKDLFNIKKPLKIHLTTR